MTEVVLHIPVKSQNPSHLNYLDFWTCSRFCVHQSIPVECSFVLDVVMHKAESWLGEDRQRRKQSLKELLVALLEYHLLLGHVVR